MVLEFHSITGIVCVVNSADKRRKEHCFPRDWPLKRSWPWWILPRANKGTINCCTYREFLSKKEISEDNVFNKDQWSLVWVRDWEITDLTSGRVRGKFCVIQPDRLSTEQASYSAAGKPARTNPKWHPTYWRNTCTVHERHTGKGWNFTFNWTCTSRWTCKLTVFFNRFGSCGKLAIKIQVCYLIIGFR